MNIYRANKLGTIETVCCVDATSQKVTSHIQLCSQLCCFTLKVTLNARINVFNQLLDSYIDTQTASQLAIIFVFLEITS